MSEDSDHYRDCGTADDHYWIASAPTRTGHDDIDPVAEPDHTTAALADRWTAVPNTDLDCWRVTAPDFGVADMVLDQAVAEHIAGLHNARLAGISAIRVADEGQGDTDLNDGSTVVTLVGMADAAGKVYAALSEEHALDLATSPEARYGPHPRQIVAWTVTTSAPVPYEPASAAAVSEVAA